MIECQRNLFNMPDDVTYLNSAYMGAQLKSVSEAGVNGLRRKEQPWTLGPEAFFDEVDVARELFARLLGATVNDIAIVPAASYGVAVAVANIELGQRKRIVVLKDQFPSNYYSWQELAHRQDGQLITVERQPDQDWTQAISAAIDDRTAVVSIPNVHWTDGRRIDLMKIRNRCDETGTILCVDLSQSLGVIPFSVKDIKPDYLFCAGYKWLMCPYGSSFLYVDPKHQDGEPIEQGWAIREDAHDFAGLANYRETYQVGARRFDAGQRSSFSGIPMVVRALRQILDWGPEHIQSTLAVLTQAIVEGASALKWSAPPARERAPHIIGLQLPGGGPEKATATLRDQKIIVGIRGTALRISPFLFNTLDDIDKMLNAFDAGNA